MNYDQAIKFLYSHLPAYHRIGKAAYKSDLNNSIALDEYLGRPHTKYLTVHVAGTNGKGSVSHMLTSVLMEAGFKTALYTSPHLKDIRERIRVNGRMIPKNQITRFIETHSSFLLSLEPSFFEMTVALAFDYFARSDIDIAVIETGLGGRLDSTNIINPILSVITNIGHDHMDLLGDTIEKIATEKAGIIKKGVPVVIGETDPESKKVFLLKAKESRSEIFFADQNYSCQFFSSGIAARVSDYSVSDKLTNRIYKGKISLGGDYQAKNIQTVFQAVNSLKGLKEISIENILDGIRKVVKNTRLMGRWQVIGRNPLVICDTGHNREGLGYVLRQLKTVKHEKLHIVIGFVNDKDLGSVLPLFPADAEYYFTKASVPRALDENILKAEAEKYNLRGSCHNDVGSAVKTAKEKSSVHDLIFIGGSTFVVADALLINQIYASKYI